MLIIFYRTVVLYFLITAVLRFTGKKQMGEMSPSELVTTFLISNIAAIPIENEDKSLIAGFVPIVIIACLEIFMSTLSLKSEAFRNLICGRKRYIIKNGVMDREMMKNLRISIDDLEEGLRYNGVFDISEVKTAVIETNGNLSVEQKEPFKCLSNKEFKRIIRKNK